MSIDTLLEPVETLETLLDVNEHLLSDALDPSRERPVKDYFRALHRVVRGKRTAAQLDEYAACLKEELQHYAVQNTESTKAHYGVAGIFGIGTLALGIGAVIGGSMGTGMASALSGVLSFIFYSGGLQVTQKNQEYAAVAEHAHATYLNGFFSDLPQQDSNDLREQLNQYETLIAESGGSKNVYRRNRKRRRSSRSKNQERRG